MGGWGDGEISVYKNPLSLPTLPTLPHASSCCLIDSESFYRNGRYQLGNPILIQKE
ncbi:MAG: hypothetical protein F6J89_32410 [Symploca sp. SIO1C4]|uniref:Uncharacterized protein n=1 Tax=Symploca sp. SIO1C4 TaxID=2607765 RepID=A0A6B3NGA1_9CYAN|nr:hypothetical protein [Symploca sp. SIO1C4]